MIASIKAAFPSAAFILYLVNPICSAETLFDLTADWSDSMNPNGVWTYREGSNALPFVADWDPSQAAWAPSAAGGNFLPGWFRGTADSFPGLLDVIAGDVAVHTTDSFNGSASGTANVIWTSPADGTIDVAGAVWMARDIGRSNDWFLLLNAAALSGGSISSGDPFDRANPFDFADGSGGAEVLQDIPVSDGDLVELRITKTSGFGDFVGVDLRITLTPHPSFYSINSKLGLDELVIIDSSDGSVTFVGSLGVDVGEADLAVLNDRLFLLRDGSNGADPQIPSLMEIAPSTGAVFSSVDLSGVGSANRGEGLATVSGQLIVAFSGASDGLSETLGELGLDGTITNPTSFSTDLDGLGADSAGNVFSTDQFFPGITDSTLYSVDIGTPTISNLNKIASVGINDLAFSDSDRLFGIDAVFDGFTSSRLLREFNPSTGIEIGSAPYDSRFNLFGLAPTIASPDSDNDGIDDSWENHFFGDLSRDGSGDFDDDGMKDGAEFHAATDPLNTLSRFQITEFSRSTVIVTITWDSIAGRVYQVHYKNGLGEALWLDLNGDISATGPSTSATDDTTGVVQRFYRVSLSH